MYSYILLRVAKLPLIRQKLCSTNANVRQGEKSLKMKQGMAFVTRIKYRPLQRGYDFVRLVLYAHRTRLKRITLLLFFYRMTKKK